MNPVDSVDTTVCLVTWLQAKGIMTVEISLSESRGPNPDLDQLTFPLFFRHTTFFLLEFLLKHYEASCISEVVFLAGLVCS